MDKLEKALVIGIRDLGDFINNGLIIRSLSEIVMDCAVRYNDPTIVFNIKSAINHAFVDKRVSLEYLDNAKECLDKRINLNCLDKGTEVL